ELGLRETDRLVGLIARWHPQKDHAGFLRAAAALAGRQPTAHFVLAGGQCDTGNPELLRLVAATGLADRVQLRGQRSDIPRLTAALDIATLASSFGEAFPSVLGEAMACAVPCVTTDVGDSADIVGDTGRVVPPGDPAALAAAWEELLALSPAELAELGERGRQRAHREFELGAVASRYEAVFREMVHGTQPAWARAG